MKNLILFLLSIVLLAILGISGFIYAHIRLIIGGIKRKSFKWTYNELSDYYWLISLSVDQTGNVIGKHIFNDLMIFPRGHRFGNPDETVSYVLGKNKIQKTIYPFGLFWTKVLHWIDKNHVEKAVKRQE